MSPNRIFKTGRWSLAALIAASLVFALPAPATTIDMVATVNFDAVQTLGGSTCPGPGTYTFTASWDDTAPYDETITFTGSDPGPRLSFWDASSGKLQVGSDLVPTSSVLSSARMSIYAWAEWCQWMQANADGGNVTVPDADPFDLFRIEAWYTDGSSWTLDLTALTCAQWESTVAPTSFSTSAGSAGGMSLAVVEWYGPASECSANVSDAANQGPDSMSFANVSIVVAPRVTDADGDAVPNASDNCPTVANPEQADADSDGAGDACDTDDDGDGVSDTIDNCVFTSNAGQADLDADGFGDACDADPDGDGQSVGDNCPLVPNAAQTDTDSDSIGDNCDDDDDNDSVCDIGRPGGTCDEGPDNCPTIFNPDQAADLDADGIGDACDIDLDGDSIPNGADKCPIAADPSNVDTDGDSLGDACENDDDGDAVLDAVDNCRLIGNADQTDSDVDGVGNACDGDLDGDDVSNAGDNCVSVANGTQADLDHDGTGDACDADIDGDSVGNGADTCPLTTAGAAILPNGCALAQLCPCAGPRGSSAPWRNHGEHVSAVAKAAKDFVSAGLMTASQKDAAVTAAGQSTCGR